MKLKLNFLVFSKICLLYKVVIQKMKHTLQLNLQLSLEVFVEMVNIGQNTIFT